MVIDNSEFWLPAIWPAPTHIKAGTTFRSNGVSHPPYASLNLAEHVEDNKTAVSENRRILNNQLDLPAAPVWLNQQHSNIVVSSEEYDGYAPADAAYTSSCNQICVVMTADCLPLLLCDQTGSEVAAAHIGWKGLSQGIIDNILEKFNCMPGDILAWFGPAITVSQYEIGEDVYSVVINAVPDSKNLFLQTREYHWLMDLKQTVRLVLNCFGINQVFDCARCTYQERKYFFSYRRDGITGRMASLIWIDSQSELD